MIEVTEDYLIGVEKGKVKHEYYDQTVDHAHEMGVHIEGDTPKKLLDITRPNEQDQVKKYRLDSYQPVTRSLSEKVINTINKVFNPRLWSFKWPDMPGTVGDDTLEKYITEDLPYYRSIMNFVTETFTQKDFSDPNAAIIVMPQNFEIEDTELFEPVPVICSAETLVDFEDGMYYTFYFKNEKKIKIFDKDSIFVFEKTTIRSKSTWTLKWQYDHMFGIPTVFRMGGIIKGKLTPYWFHSWVSGVLPHWNQVVTLTSDLQAAYVNHLYMDKWEFATECDNPDCNGGNVSVTLDNDLDSLGNPRIIDTKCGTCNGTGKVTRSPYGVHTINRDALNPEAPLPTPPAGYIDKPIDVVDKVEARIKDEESRGLSSINMEIVQMVGEDQSGVAKTVDREDLNAFLSRYSRHVFEYVLPNLIEFIAVWRYNEVSDITSILPEISQPKDFNILTLNQLTSEYKDASNANVSANYLQHIEQELVESKFANNAKARMKNHAIIELQPYPGKSVDQLLTLKSMGEPEWKIYKSINIIELVSKAIEDNEGFLELSTKEQREIIDEMAKTDTEPEEIEVIPPEPPPFIEENET
jgi:hypothetical protein